MDAGCGDAAVEGRGLQESKVVVFGATLYWELAESTGVRNAGEDLLLLQEGDLGEAAEIDFLCGHVRLLPEALGEGRRIGSARSR